MNRPTLRDLRKQPWLTASAVLLMATGLVAAGDAPARGASYANVRRGSVTATAGAAGTVQSADTRELAFGTNGTVTEVKVAAGDKVKAGAILARLDDGPATDQLAVAKAALAAADETYGNAQQGICLSRGGGAAHGTSVSNTDYSRPSGRATPTPTARPTRPQNSPTPTPTPTTRKPTQKPTQRPTHSPRPTGHPKPTAHPSPTTHPTPTAHPTSTHRPTPSARPNPGGKQRPGGPGGNGRGGSGGRGQGGGCKPGAVEQAAAAVTQAGVNVREAERTLDATTLKAPIAGTVLSVAGTPGSQVSAGKSGFITLGDLDDLQVQAMFPLGEVDHLAIGQQATISLGMLAGRQYAGSVTRIDPAATTSGNRALYGVMISLNDEPPGLLTGMSASVEVVTAQADNALYVPVDAVHPATNGPRGTATVLVRHDGRTTTRTVRIGVQGDRYAAITSGLSEGDRVVLPGGIGDDGFPDGSFPGA